jgi:bacterioferritin
VETCRRGKWPARRGRARWVFRRTAITEMGHVEALAERILFLKGDVTMAAAEVQRIADPAAILEKAIEMEEGAPATTTPPRRSAAGTRTRPPSRFERLAVVEEGHGDQFEKQLDNIRRFGLNYLAL